MRRLVEDVAAKGVSFARGLSTAEVGQVEGSFGFTFPPDLRALLMEALPVGGRFPDWRSAPNKALKDLLDLPLERVLFDVEYNSFWLPEWGQRPASLADTLRVAEDLIRGAPRLVPVCGHRMIPAEPALPGNPVFSVHQTDIIIYGFDLDDYFRAEFGLRPRRTWPEEVRKIRFWDIDRFQQVRWNDTGCVYDNRDGRLP